MRLTYFGGRYALLNYPVDDSMQQVIRNDNAEIAFSNANFTCYGSITVTIA